METYFFFATRFSTIGSGADEPKLVGVVNTEVGTAVEVTLPNPASLQAIYFSQLVKDLICFIIFLH